MNRLNKEDLRVFTNIFWSLYTKSLYAENTYEITISFNTLSHIKELLFSDEESLKLLSEIGVLDNEEYDKEILIDLSTKFKDFTRFGYFRHKTEEFKHLCFEGYDVEDENGRRTLRRFKLVVDPQKIDEILEKNDESTKELTQILVDKFIELQKADDEYVCESNSTLKLVP